MPLFYANVIEKELNGKKTVFPYLAVVEEFKRSNQKREIGFQIFMCVEGYSDYTGKGHLAKMLSRSAKASVFKSKYKLSTIVQMRDSNNFLNYNIGWSNGYYYLKNVLLKKEKSEYNYFFFSLSPSITKKYSDNLQVQRLSLYGNLRVEQAKGNTLFKKVHPISYLKHLYMNGLATEPNKEIDSFIKDYLTESLTIENIENNQVCLRKGNEIRYILLDSSINNDKKLIKFDVDGVISRKVEVID